MLALAAGLFFLALGAIRAPLATLDGDEGTYLAMATSLVRDGDLRFTGLLTVSAPDLDALDAACALTESAARSMAVCI